MEDEIVTVAPMMTVTSSNGTGVNTFAHEVSFQEDSFNRYSGLTKEDREYVRGVLKSITEALARIDEEKQLIDDYAEDVFAKTGVKKTDVKALAVSLHKGDLRAKILSLTSLKNYLDHIMNS